MPRNFRLTYAKSPAIMRSMSFDPTPEQNDITDAADTGKNLVVVAVAGSGKTSTLRLIGEAIAPKRALYMAFGKDVQRDAEASFPSNVTCKTAHSVALAWLYQNQPDLGRRLSGAQPKPWDAPKTLGIPGGTQFKGTAITIGERTISSRAAASFAVATVTKFCHSADTALTFKHVPNEFGYGTDDQKQFEAFVLGFAKKAWADFTNPNGRLTMDHRRNGPDVYLKLWSLACPALAFDTILFDEAQDADPAIAHVIRNQSCQIIMVGDPAQAIYGWRGAVDAMSDFAQIPGVDSLTLSQSFRFGPAVAEVANRFLDLLARDTIRVIGNPVKDSTVGTLTDADAILCRTNAAVIEYAMDAQSRGRQVAIAGGTGDIEKFMTSAQKLIDGKGMPSGDLEGFDTWGDVREFAQSSDADASMKRLVKLVDEYGTPAIIEICNSSVNEDDADVVISTAHKSKGREWDSVRIAGDFVRSGDEGEAKEPSTAELMLMYVAVTRAKMTLDFTAISHVGQVAA